MEATQEVTFITPLTDLRLIRKASRTLRDGDGFKIGTSGPEEGESPWVIDFDGEMFKTDDPVLIKFIRKHELFNNKTSGIWEEGHAPDEPQPTLAAQTQAIGRASVNRDQGALQEILEVERNTHNRAAVIQSAESALLTLAELPPEAVGAGGPPNTGDPVSSSPPSNPV